MLLPIISYVVFFMSLFFMYYTVKRLTEIRDILKELNAKQKIIVKKIQSNFYKRKFINSFQNPLSPNILSKYKNLDVEFSRIIKNFI